MFLVYSTLCCSLRTFCFGSPRIFVHFRVRAALFDHTGVPFPLIIPQGAGIGNSRTSLRPRFEGCAQARQPSGQEAHSEDLFRKECQGCRRLESQAAPPHKINLPRRLSPQAPSHSLADRWLRQVISFCLIVLCSLKGFDFMLHVTHILLRFSFKLLSKVIQNLPQNRDS